MVILTWQRVGLEFFTSLVSRKLSQYSLTSYQLSLTFSNSLSHTHTLSLSLSLSLPYVQHELKFLTYMNKKNKQLQVSQMTNYN